MDTASKERSTHHNVLRTVLNALLRLRMIFGGPSSAACPYLHCQAVELIPLVAARAEAEDAVEMETGVPGGQGGYGGIRATDSVVTLVTAFLELNYLDPPFMQVCRGAACRTTFRCVVHSCCAGGARVKLTGDCRTHMGIAVLRQPRPSCFPSMESEVQLGIKSLVDFSCSHVSPRRTASSPPSNFPTTTTAIRQLHHLMWWCWKL